MDEEIQVVLYEASIKFNFFKTEISPIKLLETAAQLLENVSTQLQISITF